MQPVTILPLLDLHWCQTETDTYFILELKQLLVIPTTQDPMFVRFSNQEDLNTYTPTATNTAGTFRLDTGNEITSSYYKVKIIFLLATDLAAYVIQFVGPPFTFLC